MQHPTSWDSSPAPGRILLGGFVRHCCCPCCNYLPHVMDGAESSSALDVVSCARRTLEPADVSCRYAASTCLFKPAPKLRAHGEHLLLLRPAKAAMFLLLHFASDPPPAEHPKPKESFGLSLGVNEGGICLFCKHLYPSTDEWSVNKRRSQDA